MGDMEQVFKKGCLIDLNVGMWLAERKLQPEDLGLSKEEVSDTFSLGHKRLIPQAATSEVRKWETLARYTLDRYSFPFPFGNARFVPRTQLQECVDKLDSIIMNFNAVADKIVADYDKHRLTMRTEFLQAAREAYRRRTLLCGGLTQTEDEYVNEFLARIDRVYPSPQDLRRKYHMEYVVFQTSLPDLTRATYADIVQDREKVRLMQEAFTLSVRKKVESFAEGVVGKMRGDAVAVLKNAASVLRNGKRVTKYTIDSVRRLVGRYAAMDLVGDEDFKSRLLDFKSRVLDVYSNADIIGDRVLRDNVATEIEALAIMASDPAAISGLIRKYRSELISQ